MRRCCFASLLTASVIGTAAAAGGMPMLEFKGLAFGASTGDALRHFANLRCSVEQVGSPLADTVCVDDLDARCSPPQAIRIPAERRQCDERLAALRTYAGTPISDLRLYFVDGRLAKVELGFPTARFDTVVAALTARYGPPRSTHSGDVRNRFGATFRDTETQWSLSDGGISVTRLSTDFSRGTMSLVSSSAGRPFENRAAPALRGPRRDS